jgi:hypothetical protein
MHFKNDSNFSEALLAAHNEKKKLYRLGTTVMFADGAVILRKRGGFVRV